MRYLLPDNTRKLTDHYLYIKIGNKKFNCPYYQNVGGIKKRSVFLGKGLPHEIEIEALKIRGICKSSDIFSTKLYMVMAGLGIDCSGFAVRILDSFLKESRNISLIKVLKPLDLNPLNLIRYKLKPFTNISADMLTSAKNTVPINNYDEIKPGDLLRLGKTHVAVIIEVEKKSGLVSKIVYAHSTSDYQEKYGVKTGIIITTNPNLPLEKQKWEENYKGINWMYKDFMKSPKNDRGFRRLKSLLS